MPRLAIAQLRPTKGDYNANLQKIGGVLAQIAKLDPPVDLAVFPETATSGYFVEGGVRDVAVTAGTLFRDLTVEHEAAGAPPIDVAIGLYEVFQNNFYNSCLYASLGGKDAGVRHVHRKVFLPTYGVFDEERFVDRGREIHEPLLVEHPVRGEEHLAVHVPRQGGHPPLRRRVALDFRHDRGAPGGAARNRAQRVAGARHGDGRGRRATAGERGAVGAYPAGHRRRARRVGGVREPGGVRGRQGLPRRLGGGEPDRRHRAARAAVRGGGAHVRRRL